MAIVPSLPSTSNPTFGDDIASVLDSTAQKVLRSRSLASELQKEPPWATVNPSRFFFPVTIDGLRWNLMFPYRFVVIDTKNGNSIVNGPDFNAQVQIDSTGSDGIISFEPLSPQWSIQLPITPEQLNIADQFAITTTATLRGIMEEHNGVRFKMINASGTFGVWPQRENITKPPGSPSIVQSLFGGTIEAFGQLANSVQNVINTATTGHPAAAPVTKGPEQSQAGLGSTGYYQALAIQQFLEQYAEAKRRPENAGWRLVFDIPKQNQSFIVTPMQFVWQQNATKPMQINYSMQLKAWRRVDLKESVVDAKPSIEPLSPGILQRILNTISAARQATSEALNLIAAVRSDVEAPLEVLRQSSLLVKDLAGVALTAADLPFQLQRDFKSAIGDVLNSFNTINGFKSAVSSNDSVASSFNALKSSYSQKEGLSLDAVGSGQLGTGAAQAQSIDPANNVFSSPESNFLLIDQVPLGNMTLSTAQQNLVDESIEAARAITVDDLKQFRATIQQLALQLSNNFGAGDAFYNQVYGLPPPVTRVTPMTLDDYGLLQTLYDVMQSYDIMTASTQIDDQNKQTNMEYVAGLAADSDIDFSVPNSKILAPVPFGLTIEGIASRYLGDPQRWLEIATLNNLRDPYIDEDGFQYPLLSNANGRQITIGFSDNLYLGQRIVMHSSTQSPSARTILNIDKLSDTSFLITLDGAPNLDNFLLSDGAYLQAYLPGTVNSQQKIFIPSNIAVSDDPNIIVPASTSTDPLTGMSKVDLLLSDTGDLAVNNFGDFRYAYGLTNIVQALKIKMGSIAGSILLHPEFGLGLKPGTINGSISATQIYASINKMIAQDPRFTGVSNLRIELQGPVLTINMAVQLANQRGVFPITFQVT